MKTHGYINHVVPYGRCLPKTLEPGKASVAALTLCDVPPAEKGVGHLRIQLESEATIRVWFNDHEVALERSSKLEEQIGMLWLTGAVRHEVCLAKTPSLFCGKDLWQLRLGTLRS